jgi:hypothetical protein
MFWTENARLDAMLFAVILSSCIAMIALAPALGVYNEIN